MSIKEIELTNRNRLITVINQIPRNNCIAGWQCTGTYAIGGLTEIGFSKYHELLLVVSSQGRGLFDCITGEKLLRDNKEEGDWLNLHALTCQGIGAIAEESISIAGLHGGGLPVTNSEGDSLELVAPNWPILDLIFCPKFQSIYDQKNNAQCTLIASDYMRAYGFSWSGRSFVYATSSDITIYKKLG